MLDLKKTLNERGMSATPQRLAILEFFQGDESHPDADQVHLALADKIGGASKTTVYRILEEFCEHGLIRRFSTHDSRKRYDGNVEEHHHLICRNCGTVKDVYLDSKYPSELTEDSSGFVIDSHSISFFGLCQPCSQQSSN